MIFYNNKIIKFLFDNYYMSMLLNAKTEEGLSAEYT